MPGDDILVGVGADVSGLEGGMNKANDATGKFTGSIGGLGSGLLGMLGPVGAVVGVTGGLVGILKDGIDQSNQWNSAMAQTDAVLKSTGGAAGVTKQQVSDLANSLSANGGLSTYADDAVASGENLLLTFTGIGKDVFPQTTQVMLDMSAAMGQDMKSSAIQLGKALNDPATGMSALQRVGVTFTAQQQEQIKAMEKSGNVMGAQKIILGELTREFGGSALAKTKSFDGQMAMLGEQFHNVTQTIGDAVLPILTQLLGWFSGFLTGAGAALPGILTNIGTAFNNIGNFLSPLVSAVQAFFAQIQGGANPLQAFGNLLGNIGPIIGNLAGNVINMIGQALPGIISQLGQWAQAFIAWIGPQIPPMLAQLWQFLGSVLGWIFGTALPNLIDQLGTWAKAFIDWIGPQLPGMLANLGVFLRNIVQWLVGTALPALINNLIQWGGAFISWIGPRIGPMLLELGKILFAIGNWILTVALPAIINQLIQWGGAFLDWIAKDVLPKLPGALETIKNKLGEWISGALGWIGTKLQEVGSAIVNGIKTGISNGWEAFKNWIMGLLGGVVDAVKSFFGIHSPSKVFAEIGSNMALGMTQGLNAGWGSVNQALNRNMSGTLSVAGSTTVVGAPIASPPVYLDGQLVSSALNSRIRVNTAVPGMVTVQ